MNVTNSPLVLSFTGPNTFINTVFLRLDTTLYTILVEEPNGKELLGKQ
jgi:hypothetical protein